MKMFSKNPANILIMSIMVLTMAFTISCSDDDKGGSTGLLACDTKVTKGSCWETKESEIPSEALNGVKGKCDEDGGILTDKCPGGAEVSCELDGPAGMKMTMYAYEGEAVTVVRGLCNDN